MIYDWLIVFFNLAVAERNSSSVSKSVDLLNCINPDRLNKFPRFVEAVQKSADAQDQLNLDLEQLQLLMMLKAFIDWLGIIPLEQATRPPKILVDSGVTETKVPWRILQCPGGPLVLQMICEKVNFALWIQEC